MKRILILVVSAVVATLTLSSVASAQATTETINFTAPFAGTLQQEYNCPGAEPIDFEGTVHVVVHITEDASGGFKVISHVNTQEMTGTGKISGEPYQFQQVSLSEVSVGDEGATELQFEASYRVISTGPPPNRPNQIAQGVFHITFGPDGEPVVVVENVNAKCVG